MICVNLLESESDPEPVEQIGCGLLLRVCEHAGKGAWDGQPQKVSARVEDKIYIPKYLASVFVSLNIDYVLRCLGARQLIVWVLLTVQRFERAKLGVCDFGYFVTKVTDSCLTYTFERQQRSIATIKGYCHQITTAGLIIELEGVRT